MSDLSVPFGWTHQGFPAAYCQVSCFCTVDNSSCRVRLALDWLDVIRVSRRTIDLLGKERGRPTSGRSTNWSARQREVSTKDEVNGKKKLRVVTCDTKEPHNGCFRFFAQRFEFRVSPQTRPTCSLLASRSYLKPTGFSWLLAPLIFYLRTWRRWPFVVLADFSILSACKRTLV